MINNIKTKLTCSKFESKIKDKDGYKSKIVQTASGIKLTVN